MDKRYKNSGDKKFTRSYDNQECLEAGAFKLGMKRGGEDMDSHVDPGNGVEKAMNWKAQYVFRG